MQTVSSLQNCCATPPLNWQGVPFSRNMILLRVVKSSCQSWPSRCHFDFDSHNFNTPGRWIFLGGNRFQTVSEVPPASPSTLAKLHSFAFPDGSREVQLKTLFLNMSKQFPIWFHGNMAQQFWIPPYQINAAWQVGRPKICLNFRQFIIVKRLYPLGISPFCIPPPTPRPPPPSVTHHLAHTTLSRTIFHTPSLSHTIFVTHTHTPSFTHNFVTHHLSHTPSFTHHFVTHHLSHTTLSHTIFHTPSLSHTIFHTNFVTHHLSQTLSHTHHLSHTISLTQLYHPPSCTHQLCHTPSFAHQLCHTPSFTHHLSHTALPRSIFHTPTLSQLCGRHGTCRRHFAWQAWHLATSTFVLRFVTHTHTIFHTPSQSHSFVTQHLSHTNFIHQAWHLVTSTFVLNGRRGTWWHFPWFRVAGMALGDICLHFAWQAWHLWHWAGSGGAVGRAWSPVTPRYFAWQARHLATSLAGAALAALGWRAVTHTTLSHTTLSHTICHTQLCHRLFVTHNFATDYLSHTGLSHSICHTQLCHRLSVTHHFVTHNTTLSHTALSHTTLSHTQLCHTQLCHTSSFTHIWLSVDAVWSIVLTDWQTVTFVAHAQRDVSFLLSC